MKKKAKEKPSTAAPAEPQPLRIANQEFKPEYPISKLKVHPDNPRIGNLQVIDESMDANGFYGAVIVQKSTGYVLAGNHRLKQATAKRARKLPVFLLDCDDATAKRILLADNRTSDLGSYNEQLLLDQLRDMMSLATGDLDALMGTGYTMDDFKELEQSVAAANPTQIVEDNPGPLIDKAAALKDKWKTAPGQIWELRRPETCPHCGGEN